MAEHPSRELDIANALLDLIPALLRKLRANFPRAANAEQDLPEWRNISEVFATPGQIRMLRVLSTRPGCTMQELAEHLEVAAPTVTAMIKRLLAQGFVERVRDEHDWRVVRVSSTDRGRHTVIVYDQFRRANLQRRLAQLSQEEIALLQAALPVLHHILEVEP